MIALILTAFAFGIFGSMFGYALRNENDVMRNRHLLDEINSQLGTILRHEATIKTLKYVAEQRAKEE
jgi:hypothetical protein